LIHYISKVPLKYNTINGTDGKIYDIQNSNFTELTDYLKSRLNKWIVIDTETTGLNIVQDRVTMIQLGDINTQFVIDTRKGIGESIPKRIKSLIGSKKIRKVGVNIKFDYNMLKQYDIVMENIESYKVSIFRFSSSYSKFLT